MFHKQNKILFLLGCLLTLWPLTLIGQSVQPLTWTDCVRIALSNNLQLKQARESIIQADADRLSAWASYIPSLSGNIGYDISKSGGSASSTAVSMGLSAKQLIFDGLATVRTIDRSTIMKEIAIINYKLSSVDIRQKLRSAYADHLKAKQNVDLTTTILSLRKDQFESVKFKYSAGRENQGAVKASEADLFSAQWESTQARRSLDTTTKELGYLLGVTNRDLLFANEAVSENPPTTTPDIKALAQENLKTRYYSLQTAAAKDSLSIAKGQLFPSLSLSAGTGLSGTAFMPDQSRFSLGLSAGIPIFQGNLYTKIRSAKSQLTATQLKESEQSRRLHLDMEQTWQAYRDSFSALRSRTKYLDAARERSKIADVQYATGLITFDIWTTIRDNLVNSEKNILDATAQIMKSEAAWTAILGGTLENEPH